MTERRSNWTMIAVVGAGSLLTGCAEAPFGLARLNTTLTREWERDEKFGPTIHAKLEELANLATAAPSLPPAEQQRLSAELLAMMREEKNSLLLRQMVKTIGAFPTEESLEGLRLGADHSDSDVRIAACGAWRRKGGSEAVEQLAKIVTSDTDVDVRIAAAREIGAFRVQPAIDALGLALEDPNPALQYRIVQSLKEITGRDLGDNVVAWRQYVQSGDAKPSESSSWASLVKDLF